MERGHQAAVQDALAFIEKHALFARTRTGPHGIQRVDVRAASRNSVSHGDGTRRPGPARPRRGSERGSADPRRTLTVGRRPGGLQGRCCSVGHLRHHASTASPRGLGCAVRRTARHRPGEAADPGDRRCRPPSSNGVGRPAVPTSKPGAASWPSSSSMIMADHRPGRSIAPGGQATLETRDANTDPDPSLSNAGLGLAKPRPCWADVPLSRRWCRRHWHRIPRSLRSLTRPGSHRRLITS